MKNKICRYPTCKKKAVKKFKMYWKHRAEDHTILVMYFCSSDCMIKVKEHFKRLSGDRSNQHESGNKAESAVEK